MAASLRPRVCALQRGAGGYGFHLHGDRGREGQFIRLVEPDTPAAAAGLLAGDRLAFVNGADVGGESHQQVVARIRAAAGGDLELVVVDAATDELLRRRGLRCRREYAADGLPSSDADAAASAGGSVSGDSDAHSTGSPGRGSPGPAENGDAASVRSERLSRSSSHKDERAALRPRLCHMAKGDGGYGFNLHSEKTKPGQFIRAVDDDSPAQRSGLRPQDKILEVNGVSVAGMQHADVVAAIKAGGHETRLLVVDAEAEGFFKRCNVLPGQEHVAGPLPEPVSERASEDEQHQAKPLASARSSVSSASSGASLPASGSSPAEAEGGLGLGLSLAQARERARQKRSAKKAPTMDWSKRNELFSNL